jgi:glutathione S-transferase
MLTLYVKPYCFYCAQVLRANEKIGAELVLRDVMADPTAYSELVATGGKGQTPFLVDTERGVSLYESLDIIVYLEKYYSKATASTVTSIESTLPD